MNVARSTMVTAAVSAAAALATTGITYASAASAPTTPQTAPATAPVTAPAATAPFGGGSGKGNEGRGNEGRGNEGREDHEEEGRIFINERSYSTHPGDCITIASGLGAKTVNVRNDSHKTVEVFRGAVCDNGAPIATVGPHSSSFGVRACPPRGIHIEDGVIASFRVVRHHGED
ncbi:hypothetical protein [Streptomyces sp. CoH27]|uniref:hypothetical protein n=1 Tax=Streptomyces sp. CoH27 TaxID=2875763 RepID=UPI001CD3775F|nr:hypothetical protein [Streptomyces sp. CoH27]